MMNIHSLVRQLERSYISGEVKQSKYVIFKMYDVVSKIDAYLNSKHTTGEKDSKNRKKAFFNIVTAAVNVWYRATDIDRKDIRVKATRSEQVMLALIATYYLQNWMKKTRFGMFLNEWGRSLARYGSSVLKFVEKDGELYPSVVSWRTLIVDPVDFNKAPIIEKLYLTPDELRSNQSYNQTVVESLIQAQKPRETLDGQDVDTSANYIEIYEVHGSLPVSVYKNSKGIEPLEGDDTEYVQQMHVLSFIKGSNDDYTDFTLYSGKEKESPYIITHLIPEEGRTLAIGAVEHLFDAQWMQNHSIKNMKDSLDLASKIVFQTSDQGFVGRNVLTAVEQGDILIHKPNEPLTLVNNTAHDIASLAAFREQWNILAQDITSTPDAIRGNTQPSGTAYRQVAVLQQESHSLFEIMTENKGLYLEEMLRTKIIPHIKKKMDTAEEIAATLEAQDLHRIDAAFVPVEVTRRMKANVKDFLLDKTEELADPQALAHNIQNEMKASGNQRFFTTDELKRMNWSEVFKDLEWELDVEITNETVNKEAVFTTLTTVLQTLATNPSVLQDPNMKLLFGRILEETGRVSAAELSAPSQLQPQSVSVPNGGTAVGGAPTEALQALTQ